MGTQLTKWDGAITMLTGLLLLVWSLAVMTLLPELNATFNLIEIVDDARWAPFNAPGMVAAILLPVVIVSIFLPQKGVITKAGQVGFMLAFLGSIMFAWVQMDRTLVWPLLVTHAPSLIDLQGPKFGFISLYWSSHALFGTGMLLFGVATSRGRSFPKWAGRLLWIGGTILALSAIVSQVRLVAVLALAPALIWIGFLQWRDRESNF